MYHCGATIVNSEQILTAKHCIQKNPQLYRIYVGLNKYHNITPSNVSYHKIYNKPVKVWPKIDVVLINLETKIEFNNSVLPICIGQPRILKKKDVAVLARWNKIKTANLSKLNVSVEKVVSEYSFEGKPSAKVECGDSGSGVYKEWKGIWYIVGLVSAVYDQTHNIISFVNLKKWNLPIKKLHSDPLPICNFASCNGTVAKWSLSWEVIIVLK